MEVFWFGVVRDFFVVVGRLVGFFWFGFFLLLLL